ncbi:MAG: hypothetical protein K8S54_06905 [Spirochaetia bacterium]|nr:hypothetical protein [Spirochaetia bacterium]
MKNPVAPPEIKEVQEIVGVWRSNRDEIVNFMKRMPPDRFISKPKQGWSATEIAEHLYLSQWNLARAIPIVLGGKAGQDKSELKEPEYEAIFEFLIKPRGAKNPVEVGPQGGMDQPTAFAALEKAMERMEKNTTGKSLEQMASRGMQHPYFGPISLTDWLWVMTNHEYGHAMVLFEKYG